MSEIKSDNIIATIKPGENQDKFKPFKVEIFKITWQSRCSLNDMMIEANKGDGSMPSFSFWGDICLNYTTLNEEELNDLTTDQIIGVANKVFEVANHSKKK